MKSIAIRNNYNLEQHQHKLHFENGLPVVVAYIRYGHNSTLENLPGAQMASILGMLTERFGQYAFNVIWVIEKSERLSVWHYPKQHQEGLALVHELLKTGYGKYLAVSRPESLIRRYSEFAQLEETVLKPNGVEMVVASAPNSVISSLAACIKAIAVDTGGEQDE